MPAPRPAKPLPLDDEDARDEDAPPEPTARALFGPVKWLCLGVGTVLAIVAFGAPALQAAPLAGLACFLGITARVAQAEEHRR